MPERRYWTLILGDNHYFKVDKPLNAPTGAVLANFTCVETFAWLHVRTICYRVAYESEDRCQHQPAAGVRPTADGHHEPV